MKRFFVMFVAALIVLAMVPQASFAHVNPPSPVNRPGQDGGMITIKGEVDDIQGTTWKVAGVLVEVPAGTQVSGSPTVGSQVTIIVTRGTDDKLVARSIVVIITVGGSTPAATSAAESTEEAEAESTAQATAQSTSQATSVATQSGVPFVTIIIEGPVEEIDLPVDVIVVYGMRVKMQHDDPMRLKIKLGDWVRINGHFDHDENNQIIVIVIIIIIVDTPPVIIVPPSNGGDGGGHHHEDDD